MWRHNSEFSAFAIGRFSSSIAVLTHRLRQGESRQPIAFHRTGDTAVYTAIQRVSHRGDQPSFLATSFREMKELGTRLRFLLLTLSSFVFLLTAKLALPRRSIDTQRCHSPIPTGGESISSVPTAHPFSYCPLAFGRRGVASGHFRHLLRPSPRLSVPASALVSLLRSCHRAARHTFSCSPPTGPPSSSSSPLPPFVQYFRRSIPRDGGARNALHSQASPVARPGFVLRRGVIPGWPQVRPLIALPPIAGSSPAQPPLAIEPRSKTSSDSSRTRHTRQLTGCSVTRRVPSVRPPAPTRL